MGRQSSDATNATTGIHSTSGSVGVKDFLPSLLYGGNDREDKAA